MFHARDSCCQRRHHCRVILYIVALGNGHRPKNQHGISNCNVVALTIELPQQKGDNRSSSFCNYLVEAHNGGLNLIIPVPKEPVLVFQRVLPKTLYSGLGRIAEKEVPFQAMAATEKEKATSTEHYRYGLGHKHGHFSFRSC